MVSALISRKKQTGVGDTHIFISGPNFDKAQNCILPLLRYRGNGKLQQQLEDDQAAWSELNKINLTEFFWKTRSSFFIWQCELHNLDCKRSWNLTRTYLGTCLELRPDVATQHLEREKHEMLSERF